MLFKTREKDKHGNTMKIYNVKLLTEPLTLHQLATIAPKKGKGLLI